MNKKRAYRKKKMKSMRMVLLVAVIFIIMIPVCVVSLFAYKILNDKLYEQFESNNQHVINAVDSNLELYMGGIENLTDFAMISDGLVNALSMKHSTEKEKLLQYWEISGYMGKLFGSRGDVESVRLYDYEMCNLYESHVTASFGEQNNDSELIEELQNRSFGCQFFGPYLAKENTPRFQLGTKIVDVFTEKVYGYLLIDLNYSVLNRIFETNQTQGDFLVLFADKQILYDQRESKYVGKTTAGKKEFSFLDKKLREDEENYYLYYQGYGKLTYIMISERSELLSAVRAAGTPLLIVSFLCCMIFIAVSAVIVNRVTRPMNILKDAMIAAQENNFNDIVYVDNTFCEIQKLAICFNVMQVEIKKLMQSEKELLKKKMESEYKALQFQITPHFLYNSLDSINCLASSYGKTDISEMIVSLSRIFRYSTQQGKNMVTLGDEIRHVQNYCLLQAVRYQDKFTVEYRVPEEFYDIPAVKFMLQPLVENAIYYGMSSKEADGRIIIGAIERNSDILVYVWDNGDGFSEEQYIKYQNYFSENDTDYIPGDEEGNKIGLQNVHIRLRFTFGEKAGVCLYREQGTAVCIQLPGREKDNV